MMGNVRLFENKLDELQALQRIQSIGNAALCVSQRHGCRIISLSPASLSARLSDHTSRQRFKEERQTQSRWNGSTCEQQMVSSRTRGNSLRSTFSCCRRSMSCQNKMLDLFYANVKDSYILTC
ncbi:hypothetical protein CHARACLAT_020403 [Characodon lateralis]|uniref:Uncharacterized protein n=1 Tax=Characodon lateralis TaxID=208331 RepID=A0ABU7D8L3_9TELE|nr:hypothetical protein [Characodon lateralis]